MPVTEKVKRTQAAIEKYSGHIEKLVPKFVDSGRLIRIARAAITQRTELDDCTEISLIGAIVDCAVMGLKLETKFNHAWLVPFKNKKANRTDCQLMIGYEGWIDLAFRSGMVQEIWSEVVYKGDFFLEEKGSNRDIKHRESTDEGRLDAQKPHVYAIAKLPNGGRPQVVLPRTKVLALKRMGGGGPAWDEPYFGEVGMWQAKAVKQLQRWLPKSDEMARAAAIETVAEIGQSQASEFQLTQSIAAEEGIIEGEFEARAASVKSRQRAARPKPQPAFPEADPMPRGPGADPHPEPKAAGFVSFIDLHTLAEGEVFRSSARFVSASSRTTKAGPVTDVNLADGPLTRRMPWWHETPPPCADGENCVFTARRSKDYRGQAQFTIDSIDQEAREPDEGEAEHATIEPEVPF